ncbi:dharma [Denticeps clupeoides]|uniref:dharma n=1 Tax=Denticeps clupeoides TaxID=299321 RepID=UPI0010A47A58|nr:homeobox protein goosecoid-2-like [Denticeps clupeoides]
MDAKFSNFTIDHILGETRQAPQLLPENPAHLYRPPAEYRAYPALDLLGPAWPFCCYGCPAGHSPFPAGRAEPPRHGAEPSCCSNPAHPRQHSRMRTVFTESQIQQLDQLFVRTDYPSVEARAELARNAGLSEETVRVWFKNRRARRKRQSTKSKSPRSAMEERSPGSPCSQEEFPGIRKMSHVL